MNGSGKLDHTANHWGSAKVFLLLPGHREEKKESCKDERMEDRRTGEREREREGGGGWGARERKTDRQADRQTGRQAGRQTDGQTDRQIDRQTETEKDRQTESNKFSTLCGNIDLMKLTTMKEIDSQMSKHKPASIIQPQVISLGHEIVKTASTKYRFSFRSTASCYKQISTYKNFC